ncbi:MAG: DUF1800 domain-containing protein [Rhodanobacter sp.]
MRTTFHTWFGAPQPIRALGLMLMLTPLLANASGTPAPDNSPPLVVTANRPNTHGLSHDDLAWLRRDSFGLDSATVTRYHQLGRAAFLDEQLAGADDTLPPQIRTLIDSYSVINTPLAQQVSNYRDAEQKYKNTPAGDAKDAAKKVFGEYRRDLYQQDVQVEMLHAIYGGDQLREQVVWFWLNHFSIYADKGPVRLFAADYEENVIRPHALGKFKDLVMATLESPAMQIYLDNAKNVAGKTNENYARELMELHTLGVGSGYTQQDVQQLALILTGAGVAGPNQPQPGMFGRQRPGVVRDGLFVFAPKKHDFSDKVLLGHTIKGRGFDEIEQAVDLITQQPACAQFVSRQLAEYFVSDKPPQTLVDAMASTFQRTDGDIAAVLRTMFMSKELTASYGHRFQDPTQFLVASMKLAYDNQPIANATPLVNWLNQMGEPLYGRITPDGWPLDSASWSGSGQMAKRFDVARIIGSGKNRLFDVGVDPDPQQHTPPPVQESSLFREAFEPQLSTATRTALGNAASPLEWNTFLLSSPDFNYR